MTYPLSPFPRKGERKHSPSGQMTTHPPAPAQRAGVASHLPRVAGEAGRGCTFSSRASAGGPAEAL